MMETKDLNSNEPSSQINQVSSNNIKYDDEISLKEVISILKDWTNYLISKWLILSVVFAFGGLMGVMYTLTKEPQYEAELTFVLEGEKPSSGSLYSSLAGQFGLGGGSASDGVFGKTNFLALLTSRKMIQRALLSTVNVNNQEITLAEFFIQIKKFREEWKKTSPDLLNVKFPPGSDPKSFSVVQNSLMRSFHSAIIGEHLYVGSKSKKESIMAIRVNSTNELFSKSLTEALVKDVSEFYISSKTERTKRSLNILEHQADSVRREFNSAIAGVSSSIDANPNPNASRIRLAVPSQSRQVDAQVNQTMLMELIKNIEMSKMTLREETPLFQVIDSPVLPLSVNLPNKKTFFLLGSVVSFILAVVFLVVKRVLNNL
jgi:uncharacterized protein involved in exopolysaccharide biosynthesis